MSSQLDARRIVAISLGLFALNVLICAPLFRVEYLDQFRSNEGVYMAFGEFLARYWPHMGWFPWSNAGMPFEDTYLPLVAMLVAVVSRIGNCSPAHALHFIAALTYSLAPVFLFLFARALSGRIAPSAWAAALWSLVSPAVIFPRLLNDLGTPWGIRRLQNIVVYGETPHNVALCLLPLSLWLTNRFLDKPTARRFTIAALAAAAVMLTNAFGIVVVSVSTLFLFAARGHHSIARLASICGILFAAYLAICRALPPTLIRLLGTNSQFVAGDYRFTIWTYVWGASFLAFLIALWTVLRRFCSPMVQFAALFSACFGAITFLSFHGVNILPQPERYHIEMEAGICLLAAFLLEPLARRLPQRIAVSCALACIVALGWVAAKDYRFARHVIHPADTEQSPEFTEARWIAANLPGVRVFDATDGQWLFNLFADNPQMSGGHDTSAPNWTQRVAVYTILTGQNAGDRDGPISILWLKVFGCGAIVVPGAASKDYYHSIANPGKFEGRLPLLRRDAGDSIYRVPLLATSLAHVIPKSAAVSRRPIHGLDVDPLLPYVAALDDPAAPPASLSWKDPDHGRILAKMQPSDIVSLQMTYDPGWQARVDGKLAVLNPDQLGFIEIDPPCSGECSIDLVFDGGLERKIALAVSAIAVAALLAMMFI
ncbi:MAG: hypothetical protein ACLPWF_04095 [Bryobacteraceae bacterium]